MFSFSREEILFSLWVTALIFLPWLSLLLGFIIGSIFEIIANLFWELRFQILKMLDDDK